MYTYTYLNIDNASTVRICELYKNFLYLLAFKILVDPNFYCASPKPRVCA